MMKINLKAFLLLTVLTCVGAMREQTSDREIERLNDGSRGGKGRGPNPRISIKVSVWNGSKCLGGQTLRRDQRGNLVSVIPFYTEVVSHSKTKLWDDVLRILEGC